MKNKLFKTTLFGYSKTDVCNYITKTNEEFNNKLEEITEMHQKEQEKLLTQNKELQEELDKYKSALTQIQEIISPLTTI